MERHHLGVAAPPDDPQAIAATIAGLLERYERGDRMPVPRAELHRHDRQNLACELAEVFNVLLDPDATGKRE